MKDKVDIWFSNPFSGCVTIFDKNSTDYMFDIRDYDNSVFDVLEDIENKVPDVSVKQFILLREFFKEYLVSISK